MNAVVNPAPATDLVTVEIDGTPVQVPKGSMIIQAADQVGIAIPRFCYHEKLSIAANCRMCLVDVEKAPKPMPACATPVMDGMKVYTQSKRALDAQRNVMEFLLINHPLDCPICDQGGECELQDLAMGYGRSVSRFTERKRVVPDEDLGPLISTDMTRCIHCTRCVRFMSEIAGTTELGGMGRGEHLEIGTYIGKSIESELSGNVIDVCPVGALTNKVYRFRARAWELVARESIGYHDAIGSNLFLHVRRGEAMRAVPRDDEAINECWLSDRDRYSHQGLRAADRATRPMVRRDGQLVETSWEEAIAFVAEGLKRHGADTGALVAPLASCEEGLLLGEIVRALGSDAIDHRLRLADATDAAAGATFERPLAAIEGAGAILLVGSNPRHDQPLLGHRIRKAWRRGAKVLAVNPVAHDFHFEVAAARIADPWQMVGELAAIADAAAPLPAELANAVGAFETVDAHRAMARTLADATDAVLVFGDAAAQHPQASLLRALARHLATSTGTAFNELPMGANAVGLTRVGAVPAKAAHGAPAMIAAAPKALVTWHAEAADSAVPAAFDRALAATAFHVHVGAYLTDTVRRTAAAVLPIGLPPETEGSYVNLDGRVQRVAAATKLPGEARAGWRVLRALGGALGVPGFGFTEFAEVAARVDACVAAAPVQTASAPAARGVRPSGLLRVATVPIYVVDAVVRRAPALQSTPLARPAAVTLNPSDALAAGLSQGAMARVSDGGTTALLPVAISTAVPVGAAWVESGHAIVDAFGSTGTPLTVTRAEG
jgi:NADH-quinone oxidoreductase subunit G